MALGDAAAAGLAAGLAAAEGLATGEAGLVAELTAVGAVVGWGATFEAAGALVGAGEAEGAQPLSSRSAASAATNGRIMAGASRYCRRGRRRCASGG